MDRIVLASNNEHKLEELKTILNEFKFDVVSMKESGIDIDIVEDGETFEENSMIKARTIHKLTGGYVVADDSGLVVDALDGAPGVYSARYAGETASYNDNNKKLLTELEDVPFSNRKARFVSVITMLFPNGEPIVARGEIDGVITLAESGQNGFGYDPLFYVTEKEKTFAELTSDEKNLISHRAKALRVLREKLDEVVSR